MYFRQCKVHNARVTIVVLINDGNGVAPGWGQRARPHLKLAAVKLASRKSCTCLQTHCSTDRHLHYTYKKLKRLSNTRTCCLGQNSVSMASVLRHMFMFVWQPAQSYQTIDSIQVRAHLKLTVLMFLLCYRTCQVKNFQSDCHL